VKLSTKNVHYLCFEGGGGKGPIYLGATKALCELGVLEYITKNVNSNEVFRLDPKKIYGVAGTSIGSLLALLIAAGYTTSEMEDILTGNYGIETLDKVEYGSIPTVFTPDNPRYIIEKNEIPEDKELFEDYWQQHIIKEKWSWKRILKVPGKAINQMGKKFLTSTLKWYFEQQQKKSKENSDDSSSSFFQDTTEIAMNKLLETTESLNSLKYDLGFFLSEFSRVFGDALIEKKSGIKNCTFQQFYKEFQIDLVITGFDITTKQTLYFRNNDQWGDLCVSDALRMSVSIPFIFKPVYLSYEQGGKLMPVKDDLSNGNLIVDGGLGNNFPLHIFDEAQSRTSKLNPCILGFRFRKELRSTDEELTVGSYAGTIFSALLGQTTELQIRSPEEQEQVIDLEHEDVDTLDFMFTEKTQQYIDKAYDATLKYFEKKRRN
jgi:predicted acylesterase/phospholipase RssA